MGSDHSLLDCPSLGVRALIFAGGAWRELDFFRGQVSDGICRFIEEMVKGGCDSACDLGG